MTTPIANSTPPADSHRRWLSGLAALGGLGLVLLSAPVIDRRALEQLRAIRMQLADARSRRTVQAMADAAEVLTPEQRAKVADRLKRRPERR